MSELVSIPIRLASEGPDVIVAFPRIFDERSEGWMGTTDHLGLPATFTLVVEVKTPTLWPISVESTSAFVAQEVARLRDQIIETAGLTRQEIASAIGVDRRSLSGFASGEIRPTPSRVESLRLLAKVAQYTASRWGERAREILLSARQGRTPLELVTAGETGVFGVLDSLDVADAAVSVMDRPTKRRPLYLAARAHGEVMPPRVGVLRDEDEYEQDLDAASAFDEPPLRRRRGRIR